MMTLITHLIRREFVPGVSAIITIHMMPCYTQPTWEIAAR